MVRTLSRGRANLTAGSCASKALHSQENRSRAAGERKGTCGEACVKQSRASALKQSRKAPCAPLLAQKSNWISNACGSGVRCFEKDCSGVQEPWSGRALPRFANARNPQPTRVVLSMDTRADVSRELGPVLPTFKCSRFLHRARAESDPILPSQNPHLHGVLRENGSQIRADRHAGC